MKSSLKRIYDNRDSFNIIENRRYFFVSNPFYLVNRFITRIDDNLNKNYLLNLKNLIVQENDDNKCLSNYNYLHNIVSSSNSKSDVFALLHVASNNPERKYTGIITEDGIGYGLNCGITDYYTNLINGKTLTYPLEVIIVKVLNYIEHKDLATSYFANNFGLLQTKLKDENLVDLMALIDEYNDNYITLIRLYNERFDKERYYYNEIYGKQLKEKDLKLQNLYNKIHRLEYNNYDIVYNIYNYIINIIEHNIEEKETLIQIVNNEFCKLFKMEQFKYLQNISNSFEKTKVTDMKVMKLVK